MKYDFLVCIKRIPWQTWALLLIILIGIFLRTYHFQEWLRFENDQVRDIVITEQAIDSEKLWPLLGPTMRASGETKEDLFRIGPMYYYFQIISASVFGLSASSMAYPDLLFGILSIPLFFYLFKRYFNTNISLILSGILAISFFAIRYSRFAWNPNSISFFVLLFLVSAHEFLVKKEKVSWFWVGVYGIALGVGVQLHATALLFFSFAWVIIAIHLFINKNTVWKKLLVTLLLACILNIPQVVSELRTGFENTRTLFHFSTRNDSSESSEKRSLFPVFADTLSCHIESNIYLLFSFQQENCNYSYVKMLEKNRAGKIFRETVFWPELIATFIFSILGYFFLGYRFRKEQDLSKKYFLGLIILFSILFFVLIFPIIGAGFKEFRYFGLVFFVPFVLFGLMIDFLFQKKKKVYVFVVVLMSIFVVASNMYSIYTVARQLSLQNKNDGHSVYFGEVKNIVRYMKDISISSEKIYVMSERIYTGNIFLPASYVAKQEGYELIKTLDSEIVPKGMPLFFLAENKDAYESIVRNIPVKSVRNFGLMRVYQLEY